MIDTSTPLGRAVAAALRLAEKRPWSTITLLEIADEAGLTLAELSRHASSKAALTRAFVRLVDELMRIAGRSKMDDRPEAVRVGYQRGDCLVFDTNIPHRGDYSSGEGIRFCVIAEFIDRDKADGLRGQAPCGPGQARQRIRIPVLDGIEVAAHPLIDPTLLERGSEGFQYGYRP